MPTRKSSRRQLGSLRGLLADVAENIQRAAYDGTTVVWVDDRADVHAELAAHVANIPDHWVVGTYNAGMPLAELVEDLRSALRERSRNWILD
jgi:hypothetical protein